MQSLESRLHRLETFQQPHRREMSDAELAVRLEYVISRGRALAPPGVWESLEELGFIQEHTNEEH
jgi:hypothetical protein